MLGSFHSPLLSEALSELSPTTVLIEPSAPRFMCHVSMRNLSKKVLRILVVHMRRVLWEVVDVANGLRISSSRV